MVARNYTYDLASRLTTRDYRTAANSTLGRNGLPTGSIADTDTFTYDDASRPLTAIKGRYSNTVTFAYDQIGRPTSEALTTNGQTYTVTPHVVAVQWLVTHAAIVATPGRLNPPSFTLFPGDLHMLLLP